ncbi:hypothetical protein D6774_02780 [Candidatus Woesearchaeota archaeon]|nr:MAG: hypothetical protein D6774_02780 [Candidatus Woesearchaeota archaeon]
MSYTIIAPVGDNLKALFVGMKEFPTREVILITTKKKCKDAKKLVKKLETFTIPSRIIEIADQIMPEMFRVFSQIITQYDFDDLIVNVATGDRMSTCATLSAAYANGLKAIGVEDGQAMLLPIMKLSYYHELSQTKLDILEAIGEGYVQLNDLAKKLNMSLSLLSYHINGNLKYKGLKEYRLVDVKEEQNRMFVKVSQMGTMLLRGYLKQRC